MTFHPENMNTFKHTHELEEKVKQSKSVLVLFCASWCPFCQNFFSTFDRLPLKHGFDNMLRVYIDDYDNPLWEDYSINAVPTVVLFDQGRVTRRLDARLGSGLTEKKFNEWLKSA
jgi:thiol-disulfide isomerase/thioredoxin